LGIGIGRNFAITAHKNVNHCCNLLYLGDI
jgi:hypothetical protein